MAHKMPVEMAAILLDQGRKQHLDPEMILRQIGVKPGGAVADIGCGPGYFTLPMSQRVGPMGRVFAVDVQVEMLQLLAQRLGALSNVDLIHSAEDKIPLADGIVDLALMVNIFHELEGDATLKEVRRILRPNGELVIIDWQKKEMEIGPPFEERYRAHEVESVIASMGFGKRGVIMAGPYHYGLVFVKE